MKQRGMFNWRADNILAVWVVVLWSFGRVLNPLTQTVLNSSQGLGPVLGFFELLYVALHALLFVYTGMLMVRFLKRHGTRGGWRVWGEFALYIYVLITLLLSLYFIAYEFGYLPLVFQGLVSGVSM